MSRSHAAPVPAIALAVLLLVLAASACQVPGPPPVTDLRWTQLPRPPFAGGARPEAVECPTPEVCLALVPNRELARWDGTEWSAASVPDSWLVRDISCPTASRCFLGGSREGSSDALFASWDGQRLVEHPLPGQGVSLLSCPEVDWCLVGQPGSLGYWDGSRVTPAPITAAGADYSAYALDCGSPRNCAAAIEAPATAAVAPRGVAHWDGTAWTVTSLHPAVPGGSAYARDVSCTGDERCAAVGSDTTWLVDIPLRSRGVASTWSPGGWSAFAPLNASASADDLYSSVSCAEPGWCAAVGYESPDRSIRPVARVWTGTGWAKAPEPDQMIDDIDCVSRRFCMAVGSTVWTLSAA